MKPPIAVRDLLRYFREQPIFHYGSLRVIHDVTHREFQTPAIHDQSDRRFQAGIFDSKIISGVLPGLLCLCREVSNRFFRYPQEHFPRETVIALRRKRNFDLIPNKPKSL